MNLESEYRKDAYQNNQRIRSSKYVAMLKSGTHLLEISQQNTSKDNASDPTVIYKRLKANKSLTTATLKHQQCCYHGRNTKTNIKILI